MRPRAFAAAFAAAVSIATTGAASAATPPPAIVTLTPAQGAPAGGTLVTITGSAFTRSTAVSFGGVRATSITYKSPTTLLATAPAHAPGKVAVKTRNAAGVSVVTTNTYFRYGKPGTVTAAAPTIKDVAPASLTAVSGGVVTVGGGGFSGVTAVTFDGAPLTYRTESDTILRADVPPSTAGTHQLLITGAGGVSTATTITTTDAASPAVGTQITGLSDRNGNTATDPALINGTTIEVRWNDTETDPSQPLDLTAVKAKLDVAQAAGMQVRLRPLGGAYAPAYARAATGAMQWRDAHTGTIRWYTVAKWWTPTYQDLYTAWLTRLNTDLAAGYPAIKEVTATACTTIYGEPFMRQPGYPNGDTIRATDYTYVKDLACLYTSIDRVAAAWPQQRVALSVNPFQGMAAPNTTSKGADALTVMRYCRTTLGDRCVLGNNSLRGLNSDTMTCPDGVVIMSSGQNAYYNLIYCEMRNLGAPIFFQTARPDTIGDWRLALERAIQYGAANVELNNDYPGYDPATLASFLLPLTANAATTGGFPAPGVQRNSGLSSPYQED